MDEGAPRRDGDEVEGPEALLERVRAALEDVVGLLRGPDAGPALTARELARLQSAIVATAHQEAAEVVAAAHADAARILEQATASASGSEGTAAAVIDLRDAQGARGPSDPQTVERPGIDPTERPAVLGQRLAAVDAELRAAISATGDLAQEVSSQIARVAGHAAPPGRG